MTFDHDVIHNGIYYQAGEEVPQPEPPAKKEEKPPVKKSSRSK